MVPNTSNSLNLLQPMRAVVDECRSEGVRVVGGDVLGAAEIVTLIVAPERDAGFVGVVEDIAAGDGRLGTEIVIDASVVVVLCRNSADRCGLEVKCAILGIRQRFDIRGTPELPCSRRTVG